MTFGTRRREDCINPRTVYSNVKVENTSTMMLKAVIYRNINTDTVQQVQCASHRQKILAAPDYSDFRFRV